MCPLVALTWFLLGSGGVPGGLIPPLEVLAPSGLNCPGSGAVRETLGINPFPREGSVWFLLLRGVKDGVRIDLRDPDGTVVLSRTLGAYPPRCEIAAQAIGIVVRRYFRDLASPAMAGTSDTAPVPTSTANSPDTSMPRIIRRQDHAAPSSAASLPSRPPRMVVGIGPAFWTRPRVPSVALDVRARLVGLIGVGVGTLLPSFALKGDLPQGMGQAGVIGLPVLAQVTTGRIWGRYGGSVGFQSLVTFERGEAQGIARPARAWRTVMAAGLNLGAEVSLGARLRIGADVALLRSVFGRSYQVDGVVAPVLEPPPWQAIFAIRLEWTLFS